MDAVSLASVQLAVRDAIDGLGADLGQVMVLAQKDGPMGAEFGKASPIGLFFIVAMMAAILFIGWRFYRRFSRMNRRAKFAEDHGIDPFDNEAIDKAMAEAGVLDHSKKRWL